MIVRKVNFEYQVQVYSTELDSKGKKKIETITSNHMEIRNGNGKRQKKSISISNRLHPRRKFKRYKN